MGVWMSEPATTAHPKMSVTERALLEVFSSQVGLSAASMLKPVIQVKELLTNNASVLADVQG